MQYLYMCVVHCTENTHTHCAHIPVPMCICFVSNCEAPTVVMMQLFHNKSADHVIILCRTRRVCCWLARCVRMRFCSRRTQSTRLRAFNTKSGFILMALCSMRLSAVASRAGVAPDAGLTGGNVPHAFAGHMQGWRY